MIKTLTGRDTSCVNSFKHKSGKVLRKENTMEKNNSLQTRKMQEKIRSEMKKGGVKMGFLMSITLSFCLSLHGTLTSGKFTLMSFLTSFVISFVISLIIGTLVPMKQVNEWVDRTFHVKPRSIPAHLLESLFSDLIYTPAITASMITYVYVTARAHGAHMPPYPLMLLNAVWKSFIIAYIIILIVMPIYTKLSFGKVMKMQQEMAQAAGEGGQPAKEEGKA